MYEKVSKYHPDKLADRIAGALVDLAYSKEENPKIAVEILLGHKNITVINETNCLFEYKEVLNIARRITNCPTLQLDYLEVPQDVALAQNQQNGLRCGDNGIFKGVPTLPEESELIRIVQKMDSKFASDGKYILDQKHNSLIICQSNATNEEIKKLFQNFSYNLTINPLGEWTGGINVDTGAVNRKLGSDLGEAVTGGGLHGKDLSKADVSITIMCKLLAEEYKKEITAKCAIGDKDVTFYVDYYKPIIMSFSKIVECAHEYIKKIGGFEKLAEYGLLR